MNIWGIEGISIELSTQKGNFMFCSVLTVLTVTLKLCPQSTKTNILRTWQIILDKREPSNLFTLFVLVDKRICQLSWVITYKVLCRLLSDAGERNGASVLPAIMQNMTQWISATNDSGPFGWKGITIHTTGSPVFKFSNSWSEGSQMSCRMCYTAGLFCFTNADSNFVVHMEFFSAVGYIIQEWQIM